MRRGRSLQGECHCEAGRSLQGAGSVIVRQGRSLQGECHCEAGRSLQGECHCEVGVYN